MIHLFITGVMGLTRQYVRYAECGLFGVVGSQKSNLLLLSLHGSKGRYCAVGVCENVVIWDLKTSEQVTMQTDFTQTVMVSVLLEAGNLLSVHNMPRTILPFFLTIFDGLN